MTNLSLFDTMEEFSLQEENYQNYLDETFGLSADILVADLNPEGSILDLDLGQNGGFKPQQADQECLEDLLLPDTVGESFGEDWMETVDIRSLLNDHIVANTPSVTIHPIPDVKPEPPRQEGMKASAFELLKALLTGAVNEAQLQTPPPVLQQLGPVSPEALVPDLPFFSDTQVNHIDTLLNIDGQSKEHSIEEFIEIQPEICLDNGDIVEIKPQFDLLASSSENGIDTESFTNLFNMDITQTSEDIESLISSGPSSPEDTSVTFYTIDGSHLDDSIQSNSDKSSQISDVEFTQIKQCSKSPKSKKEQSRQSPYDSSYELDPPYGDKKTRKKVQNKNAATRYRVKKKGEKESLHDQEKRLSDTNKELREKTESLQREIKYMKELMNEIYKAKKSNI